MRRSFSAQNPPHPATWEQVDGNNQDFCPGGVGPFDKRTGFLEGVGKIFPDDNDRLCGYPELQEHLAVEIRMAR